LGPGGGMGSGPSHPGQLRPDIAERRLDPPHRAGGGAEHDGLGLGEVAAEADAGEQRAIGDAGRRKDDIVRGHVLHGVLARDVGSHRQDPRALLVLLRHEPALHLPADAAQRRRFDPDHLRRRCRLASHRNTIKRFISCVGARIMFLTRQNVVDSWFPAPIALGVAQEAVRDGAQSWRGDELGLTKSVNHLRECIAIENGPCKLIG